MHINLTWNCTVCVGVAFLCLLCACLPSLTTEWTEQQYFAKTKMGYISSPSILNAKTGRITRCYCIIRKMVILHDAIKTIQNGVFVFFLKKGQKPVSFWKITDRLFFFKNGFFWILPGGACCCGAIKRNNGLNGRINTSGFWFTYHPKDIHRPLKVWRTTG